MAAPNVEITVEGSELTIRILPEVKHWTFHRGFTVEQLAQELDTAAQPFVGRTLDQDTLVQLRVVLLWVLLKWDSAGAVTIPHIEA